MSDVTVEWEIRGLDRFVLELEELARRAMNLEPALQEVGETWVGWIEEQFESQGRRFLGHKWTKLAAATISKRKATGPILIDKADLLLAMTDPSNVHATDEAVILDVSHEQVRIGGFHQSGTTGAHSVPERPIFSLNEIDQRRSVNIVEEFLLGRGI